MLLKALLHFNNNTVFEIAIRLFLASKKMHKIFQVDLELQLWKNCIFCDSETYRNPII